MPDFNNKIDFKKLLDLKNMFDFKLILHKEMIDIFRDKRSFIMLFVPVLLFPMMFLLMSTQYSKSEVKDHIPCIVWCTDDEGETLYHSLFDDTEDEDGNRIQYIEEIETDKTDEEALKDNDVYVVLTFSEGSVELLYNDKSSKSETCANLLFGMMDGVRLASADAVLEQKYDVNREDLAPFQLEMSELEEDSGDGGNAVLASLAPMLLVVLIMSGGISVAVDLFTGEKERGTFESLMTTQASRMSILMAKFVATLLLSLMGMFLSIVAYVVSIMASESTRKMLFGDAKAELSDLNFGVGKIMSLLFVCVALCIFAVSLMTLIGLNAKTVKEAQSQMSLLTILPTLVSSVTMFMDISDISPVAMWIPVFNTVVTIKKLFLGTAEPVHILCTILSCMIYSGIMWFLSVKMLRSERLLRG